jgi:hypothetical protein
MRLELVLNHREQNWGISVSTYTCPLLFLSGRFRFCFRGDGVTVVVTVVVTVLTTEEEGTTDDIGMDRGDEIEIDA